MSEDEDESCVNSYDCSCVEDDFEPAVSVGTFETFFCYLEQMFLNLHQNNNRNGLQSVQTST